MQPMMLSFNAIITMLLVLYVIWMAFSEHRKEQTSAATLTPEQLSRFNEAYVFAQPAAEYAKDLQDHAAVAQRARIRKAIAVILLIAVVLLILFRGL